jgi:PAS domain S-box-containing protein
MDLAYPDDQAAIMSAWNSLVQGNPVTFEMRWKAKAAQASPQWVLSACVPIFEDGKLVSIAGNTIDINASKTSAEAAQAKVEALEQVRVSEGKFARFAKLAPICIYIFKPGKGLQYVNDQFFELTGMEPKAPEDIDFSSVVVEEDIERVNTEWEKMIVAKTLSRMEYGLKKTWINQDGVRDHIWVQGSSYPELDENGTVVSVMGTIFDISHFRWAESVQRQRVEEALEAKRQQEK